MADKILFITLNNIGDALLTLPALDYVKAKFPHSKVTVMVGARPKEIFENNPSVDNVIVFDKHSGFREKINLFKKLKSENFGIVIDFRNSFFGAFLPAAYKTSFLRNIPKNITLMRDRHVYRVQEALGDCAKLQGACDKVSLWMSKQDEEYSEDLLKENNIKEGDRLIVISPGARSHIKRWPKEKFVELILKLIEEFKAKIILVGDKDDSATAQYIREHSRGTVADLSGKTGISQLAYVVKKSCLFIGNDSATLHLASYCNIPIVALFGPTDESKYGPWSEKATVVKKDLFCRPCEKAQCRFGTLKCMQIIKVEDVLRHVRNVLTISYQPSAVSYRDKYRRILIVRTDRIGDVLLSTPVIEALREAYPYAYIAMMVSPYAKEIVEGNPYLDEVILYDKDCKHKSFIDSVTFSRGLKKFKFDLALVLHPTNRVNLVTFFAGIKRRIGYDRKCGFLLTDRIPHTKQWGEKHELEYALDLARYIGIKPKSTKLYMPIKPESENWVNELFALEDLKSTDKLLGIHPAASCPSKLWPVERFARAADALAEKYGFKILVFSGPKDRKPAETVINHMTHKAVNLAGKTSVSQLTSVLKRCTLFISNDSGPVHIASAVGVPVISIFGRNQRGLSPKRWAPVGTKDVVLHKEVGCRECFAHNCVKNFACLQAITVDDVLNAADAILKKQ